MRGQAYLPRAGVAQPGVRCRPQTRCPSPFKNKNKYLCCMLCVLGFSFLLQTKNRRLSHPGGDSCPACRWAGPGLALRGPCQVLT